MFIDSTLEFADATSVGTPNNSTVNVGNLIDTSVIRDVGAGHPFYLVITIDTAITGTTSTVAFLLVSDSTDTIATDGNATKHIETDAIAEAKLVAGYTMVIPMPSVNPPYERYLGLQVKETSSNVLTAGNINAFLTLDPVGWSSKADGNK